MEVEKNQIKLLILQHPAEAKRPKGTAHLITENYPHAVLKKGLSWPNFKKALGDASAKGGREWAVLYLGGKDTVAKIEAEGFYQISKSKKPEPLLPNTRFEGVVLIDGNFKEAKALWWRNPWLLRLTRLVVQAPKISAIRSRQAARSEALHTAECAVYVLKTLGHDPKSSEALSQAYLEFSKSPE